MNHYESPESQNESTDPQQKEESGGKLGYIIGIILLLPITIFFALGSADFGLATGDVPQVRSKLSFMMGAGLSPVVMTGAVMGIFAIWKKNRNARKMAKVAFWTLVILAAGNCNSYVQKVSHDDSGEHKAPPLEVPNP